MVSGNHIRSSGGVVKLNGKGRNPPRFSGGLKDVQEVTDKFLFTWVRVHDLAGLVVIAYFTRRQGTASTLRHVCVACARALWRALRDAKNCVGTGFFRAFHRSSGFRSTSLCWWRKMRVFVDRGDLQRQRLRHPNTEGGARETRGRANESREPGESALRAVLLEPCFASPTGNSGPPHRTGQASTEAEALLRRGWRHRRPQAHLRLGTGELAAWVEILVKLAKVTNIVLLPISARPR